MAAKIKSPGLSFCIAILLVIIPGCSLTGENQATDQSVEISMVWPQKPAKARIAYVNSFATAAELGISRSFFARIVDFFTGRQDWHLVRPMAVLVADDGKIYVADPGSRGVHRFDTKNSKYLLIQAQDNQALLSPTGLALGAKGEIYITDSFLGQVFVVPAGSDTAIGWFVGAMLLGLDRSILPPILRGYQSMPSSRSRRDVRLAFDSACPKLSTRLHGASSIAV